MTFGAISFMIAANLVKVDGSAFAKPVILPSGRARLATKPLKMGSVTLAKMIGSVRVACFSSFITKVLSPKIASGLSATSSAA